MQIYYVAKDGLHRERLHRVAATPTRKNKRMKMRDSAGGDLPAAAAVAGEWRSGRSCRTWDWISDLAVDSAPMDRTESHNRWVSRLDWRDIPTTTSYERIRPTRRLQSYTSSLDQRNHITTQCQLKTRNSGSTKDRATAAQTSFSSDNYLKDSQGHWQSCYETRIQEQNTRADSQILGVQ